MSGIHGPNDFVQSSNHLARFVTHLLKMTALRLKWCSGSRSGSQHGDFSETRSQFIVEILGNTRPFLFHSLPLFDTLSFPDLDFKFGRALLNLVAKLSNPKHRGSQNAG